MDPATLSMMMKMFSGSAGGLGQMFGGLFGNSDAPYKDAENAYKPYMDKAEGALNPYNEAGKNALNPYQDMLKNMSDPSGFMNNLMGQYQESPYAKYQQQQANRAAQNLGSASGLSGSTPLMQQAQQNSQNISSGDMQSWLSNVLGINNKALDGYGNLISGGESAGKSLADLFSQQGKDMAGFAYGKKAGEQQDNSNFWGGLGNLITGGMFGGK